MWAPGNTEMNSDEPTVASIWRGVTAVPITDEFLDWPPDVFALTDVIVKRSEAYRFILSKRPDMKWPPSRFRNWTDAVDEAASETSTRRIVTSRGPGRRDQQPRFSY